MNSKSDTIDELFDEYYPVGVVKPNKEVDSHKAELMTKILKHRRDDFKARLKALLLRERIDELSWHVKLLRERFNAGNDSNATTLRVMEDRIQELSRLSGEESHE